MTLNIVKFYREKKQFEAYQTSTASDVAYNYYMKSLMSEASKNGMK